MKRYLNGLFTVTAAFALGTSAHAFTANLSTTNFLTITGGDSGECINITSYGISGDIHVSPCHVEEDEPDVEVSLNSLAAEDGLWFYGVQSMRVNLNNGGSNYVNIWKLNLPGAAQFFGKAEDDHIMFSKQNNIGGALKIDLKNGENGLVMEGANQSHKTYVGLTTTIDTGLDDDTVFLKRLRSTGKVRGNFSGGDDHVELRRTHSENTMVYTLGGGNNETIANSIKAKWFQFSSVAGLDIFDFNRVEATDANGNGFFELRSGGSNDDITTNDMNVQKELYINCQGGDMDIAELLANIVADAINVDNCELPVP